MAKRVQHIRHTVGGADAFVGLEGEVTADLTAKELRLHDGLTKGGVGTARKDLVNVADASETVAGKMTPSQVAELSAATTGIATNAGNLTSEIAARIADVNAEEARAVSAENSLQTAHSADVATLEAADTTLQANIDTEETDRIAADASLQSQINTLLSLIYQVGAIYTSTVNTNPATLFGFGNWTSIRGQVLMAEDGTSGYVAGNTGGSKDAVVVQHDHGGSTSTTGAHTHGYANENHAGSSLDITSGSPTHQSQIDQTTSDGDHSHTISSDGVSGTNANMPPYFAVYMWKRTA